MGAPGHRNARSSFLCDLRTRISQKGWAVGSFGAIAHTKDGGISWQLQKSQTTAHLFSVAFSDELNGIAVGARGTLLVTSNGGVDWKPQTDISSKALTGVTYSSHLRAVVVGYAGTILETRDAGVTWQTANSLTTTDLLSIYFKDDKVGWATGDDGLVLTTADGGSIWLPVSVRTSPRLSSVHFADESLGLGSRGGWFDSAHGRRWSFVASSHRRRPRRSLRFSSSTILAVGPSALAEKFYSRVQRVAAGQCALQVPRCV